MYVLTLSTGSGALCCPSSLLAPCCLPCWLQAVRNCVVLPCLHFLYCDTCFKKHCTVTPTCPACNMPVSGFQTLMLSR